MPFTLRLSSRVSVQTDILKTLRNSTVKKSVCFIHQHHLINIAKKYLLSSSSPSILRRDLNPQSIQWDRSWWSVDSIWGISFWHNNLLTYLSVHRCNSSISENALLPLFRAIKPVPESVCWSWSAQLHLDSLLCSGNMWASAQAVSKQARPTDLPGGQNPFSSPTKLDSSCWI